MSPRIIETAYDRAVKPLDEVGFAAVYVIHCNQRQKNKVEYFTSIALQMLPLDVK